MLSKQPGMSLLEVMFFVTLAGILYSTIGQMIPKKKLSNSLDEMVLGLNSLCYLAAQESFCKNRKALLEFKLAKNNFYQVRAKILEPQAGNDELQFEAINAGFVQSKLALPQEIKLVNWQVGTTIKADEKALLAIPFSAQGISLPVIIHLVLEEAGQQKKFSLLLNPFTCQFKLSDQFVEFVKEEKVNEAVKT